MRTERTGRLGIVCAIAAGAGFVGCGIGTIHSSGDRSVPGGDPVRGRAILESGDYGCIACHTIPGIKSPRGIVGPPLAGMAHRTFIAGQLPNRPDVLVPFLQDPPALVPRTGMPDVRLSLEDARHIAAYLYTLEPPHAR